MTASVQCEVRQLEREGSQETSAQPNSREGEITVYLDVVLSFFGSGSNSFMLSHPGVTKEMSTMNSL